MGSGRYYARFSQGETVPAPNEDGLTNYWLFEAFDAEWFDKNSPPETPTQDYYDVARLFVLETQLKQRDFNNFPALQRINRVGDDPDENDEWVTFWAQPRTAGEQVEEGQIPLTIYSNLFGAGVPASTKEVEQTDPSTSARLSRTISTSQFPDATESQIDATLAGSPAKALIGPLFTMLDKVMRLVSVTGPVQCKRILISEEEFCETPLHFLQA